MRSRLLPVVLISTAVVTLLAAALLTFGHNGDDPAQVAGGANAGQSATGASAGVTTAVPASSRNSLSGAIEAAQVRLRTLPKDYQTWAQLGSAYVQQARVTGDPSYYPKAQGALEHSLQLKPTDNVAAMIGQGSLANARHEFSQARDWGRKATAANPYQAGGYGVLADALTQLGDYTGADTAVQKMLDLQPGLASFSRASYAFEERGQTSQARDAMKRALAEATDPADVGFCRYYLGELDFNSGDPKAAMEQYRLGLLAAPNSDPLLAGRAKAEAALGRTDAAVTDYAEVVARLPLPEYVLEYAQLLTSLGRTDQAKAQFSLLTSIQQLFTANGVVDDLTSAIVAADYGSPTEAVQHAQAEWARRHSVLVADALGWALHRAGQDKEALTYAVKANQLGWHNATFVYHLGMIELALGRRDAARGHLSTALRTNPHFDRVQAPKATAALNSLGGPR
jgi:tetratricopeptide (TPR) repeat protein